jgi:hypothetical protein
MPEASVSSQQCLDSSNDWNEEKQMKLFDDDILDRDLYPKCTDLQVYCHCKHKPGTYQINDAEAYEKVTYWTSWSKQLHLTTCTQEMSSYIVWATDSTVR